MPAAVDLSIPAPSDPDNDHLIVQVTGLPRGGAVLVADRPVLIGDYLTVEQLRSAAFRPDRSVNGDAGAFTFLVNDGQGGSTRGAVAIVINPSNHAPEAPAEVSRCRRGESAAGAPADRPGRRRAHHPRPARARQRHGAGRR